MKTKKMIRSRFFYRTFTALMLISLLTVLYFGFYLNHIVSENQRERTQTLNFQQLTRARDSVDTILELLAQNMENTMWEETVREALINPGEEDPLQEDRILGILGGYLEGNSLIQRAWLYIPYTDLVYSSINTCVPVAYSAQRELIEYYRSLEQPGSAAADSPFTWRVLSFQNQQYLVTELGLPELAGAMILQLDHTSLLRMIQAEVEEYSQKIYVYDEAGHPLSTAYHAGLEPEELAQPENFAVQNGEENPSARFYQVISPLSGWTFLTEVRPEGQLLDSFHVLVLLLPTLLIYFFLSLGLTYVASRRIYRPIHSLIQTVLPEWDGKDSGAERPGEASLPLAGAKLGKRQRTEVDDLQEVFQDTLKSNQRMEALMREISQDVVEQQLRKIVLRRGVEEQETEKILRGFGKDRMLSGRFVVWACQILWEGKGDAPGLEQSLYQRSFLQVVRGLPDESGECEIYAFFTLPNLCAVILCLSDSLSAFRIKEVSAAFQKALQRKVQEMPYGILSGSSRICKRLEDISFAYQEALEQVQHRQYEDASAGEEETQAAEKVDSGGQYRRAQLRMALDMARKGHLEEARKMVAQEIQEISQETQEEGTAACEHFLEDMVEAVLSQNVGKEEMVGFVEQARMADVLAGCSGQEERLGRVTDFCGELLGILASNSRKNRYKYVDEAKEYMKEHCADSSLSLNDIGEVIGISGQYLSSLFKEVTGESFINYLNSYRVKLAEQFLCMTELPVKEVGYRCGFNSFQSFSRVFKKHTAMTPGQYRDKRKKEGGKAAAAKSEPEGGEPQ